MSSIRCSRTWLAFVLLAALATVSALPAAAQGAGPEFHLGVRGGLADFSGDGFFRAFPDDNASLLGAQGELRWPAFSLRLAYEQADLDGSYDPGFGNPVVLTPNFDVDGDLSMFHLTAAYNGGTGGAGWSWFAGGGPTYLKADVTGRAPFSGVNIAFESDGDSTGVHAVGGVRWALGQRLELGGEVMYVQTLDDLDLGDDSIDEDDDDLDGFSGVATLSFGF